MTHTLRMNVRNLLVGATLNQVRDYIAFTKAHSHSDRDEILKYALEFLHELEAEEGDMT